MNVLTDFDKRLLREIQHDLPRVSRPFQAIAEKIDSDEETVLERLNELKKNGYIRKLGAFIDSAAMGYTSTLIALSVMPEKIAEVAEHISKEAGVTHNYEREGEYNLWFTLQMAENGEKEKILQRLKEINGVRKILDLPAEKKYKIRVELPLE